MQIRYLDDCLLDRFYLDNPITGSDSLSNCRSETVNKGHRAEMHAQFRTISYEYRMNIKYI